MRKMKRFLLCIISFVTGLCAVIIELNTVEICNIPPGQLGQCITIKQCPALLNLLEEQPMPSETKDYLRSVSCGFEGLEPKVCCPFKNEGGDIDAKILKTRNGDRVNLLLPSTDTCGLLRPSFIVGGSVSLGEYPWMALIKYNTPNGDGFYCEGTLINKRYVLTAAHCVKGKRLESTWRLVSVRLGEHSIGSKRDCEAHLAHTVFCSDPPIDVPVEKQIVHEDYNPSNRNGHHDIALLRLAKKIMYSDYVQPICLPTSEDLIQKDFIGEKMIQAGWTENLSETRTKVQSDAIVKPNFNYTNPLDNNATLTTGQMYVESQEYKECARNSGSPLIKYVSKYGQANYFVTGVLSFAHSCSSSVYIRVTEYIPWIISKLEL